MHRFPLVVALRVALLSEPSGKDDRVVFRSVPVHIDRGGFVVAGLSEESWQIRAACRGPLSAVFFAPTQPERKEDRIEREGAAKAICYTCSVRVDCLDYAVRIREPHGVWGGMNEFERKQLVARQTG